MTAADDDLATGVIRQLVDAWEARGLPIFDLAASMMVHGAAGVFAEMGRERLTEALAQMVDEIASRSPPGFTPSQH
jgi:hypothetical protein